MCGAEPSHTPSHHTLGDFLDKATSEQMNQFDSSSDGDFDDESLQRAIELSLAENKTQNNRASTSSTSFATAKMTNQRKRHRIKTKASTSRSNCDEFEQYWRECCTFLRRYDRQRRKAQAVLRREKLDACMNQRQLTSYTPYGSLSAYTQYLLHTKCATLHPFIPSVKSLLHLMMIEHSEWVEVWTVRESWWGTYRTQVQQERRCHVSVGDPRAEVNVRIKTVLKADEMLRFAHRMQYRKKRKNAHPIGLIYTTANLTELEQECTVKLKSGSTLQDDSEMIKYFGKDLLISGFLRQFSNDTVYADVETLCLRYYHLHGATHEYSRRYTRNERVRCFKYNSVVEWMERYGRRDAYLCLCPLWDGFDSRDVQLHSLLPVYRVSVQKREDSNPKRYYYGWREKEIRKRQPHRYVMRKWSAYHKLNRI